MSRQVELSLDGEWRCTPAADNVLRLDRFRFAVTGPEASTGEPHVDEERRRREAMAALAQPDVPAIEPKPVINVLQDLERAGWPIGVEVAPVFGAPPVMRLKLPATAWYATTFSAHHLPPSAKLCLEGEALSGAWALWVNGHPVSREAFTNRRRWDVSNLEAEVAPLLHDGLNEILVSVQLTESWDGLLDAVYLLGDFGVAHDSAGTPVLSERPARVRWGDLVQGRGGYPYYAGTLHLTRAERLAPDGGGLVIRLPDEQMMFAGIAELAIDGHSLGVRAWAPYAWTVPSATISTGPTEITLSVTNTLVGQLEGKRYDPQSREVVPIVEPGRLGG
jgi:hypothetical protein